MMKIYGIRFVNEDGCRVLTEQISKEEHIAKINEIAKQGFEIVDIFVR